MSTCSIFPILRCHVLPFSVLCLDVRRPKTYLEERRAASGLKSASLAGSRASYSRHQDSFCSSTPLGYPPLSQRSSRLRPACRKADMASSRDAVDQYHLRMSSNETADTGHPSFGSEGSILGCRTEGRIPKSVFRVAISPRALEMSPVRCSWGTKCRYTGKTPNQLGPQLKRREPRERPPLAPQRTQHNAQASLI